MRRSRALGLTAISLGFLMITLDATIVNVALGPIGGDLGGAQTFPPSRDRRHALGVWGGASGIGLAAGPVLGGVLTATLGWRAIFLVNLPVAAVAAELLRRHVGETPRQSRPLDLPGQVLATCGLAALTGGFIIAGSRGWDERLTLALLITGVASAGAFALGVILNFCLYGSIFCRAIDLHRAHGLATAGAYAGGIALALTGRRRSAW